MTRNPELDKISSELIDEIESLIESLTDRLVLEKARRVSWQGTGSMNWVKEQLEEIIDFWK